MHPWTFTQLFVVRHVRGTRTGLALANISPQSNNTTTWRPQVPDVPGRHERLSVKQLLSTTTAKGIEAVTHRLARAISTGRYSGAIAPFAAVTHLPSAGRRDGHTRRDSSPRHRRYLVVRGSLWIDQESRPDPQSLHFRNGL